jgi:hypothetical protein
MTMPTPEKTWQFDVNNPVGQTGVVLSDGQTLMMAIVRGLVDMPLNPWIVMGSSDGATAGMDGVNRWKPAGTWDFTKLVWNNAGSAHGWIVLRQAALFSTCELCIDLSYTNPAFITFIWGITAFTGGTTLNRPTTTTSVTLINQTWWAPNSGSWLGGGYVHVMQSTDGECSRVVFMWDDIPILFWIFDKVKNPVAGWTLPVVVYVGNNANNLTSVMTVVWYSDTARLNTRTPAAGNAALFMTGEGYGAYNFYEYTALTQPNQLSGEVTVFPIGLVSETTGFKGRHGELYDIWWGPTGIAAGTPAGTWPDDTTRKYWSPDALILPWDGLVSAPGSIPLTRY